MPSVYEVVRWIPIEILPCMTCMFFLHTHTEIKVKMILSQFFLDLWHENLTCHPPVSSNMAEKSHMKSSMTFPYLNGKPPFIADFPGIQDQAAKSSRTGVPPATPSLAWSSQGFPSKLICLVVWYTYPSEKSWTSSVGVIIPNIWKVIKILSIIFSDS